MSDFKQQVYSACIGQLETKITSLQAALRELEEGAAADSKSSAGDKHETARAMMQLEQEKLSAQLKDTLQQLADLQKISVTPSQLRIGKGSLVKTDKGWLFLALALGKLHVEGTGVFVLSLQSPLGQKLVGLGKGDEVQVGNAAYIIGEVH